MIALAALVATLLIGAPIALAAAPGNDNFAAAEPIPGNGLAVGSNLEATAETGEPAHAGNAFGALHSIWYSWTPPSAGTAAINTCGSAFDTRLGVYTGSSVDALTEVAANEDAPAGGACPGSKFSEVVFSVAAGTTYFIAVDTSGDLAGDGSGPARGEVRLALSGPGIGPDPDPDPDPSPEPSGETETTTPGTAVPVSATRTATVMPDLEPEKVDGRWQFKAGRALFEALKSLAGLNYDLSFKAVPLTRFPRSQEKQLREQPGSGSQIMRTGPRPGEPLESTITTAARITVLYWDPAQDQAYLRELRRQEEREQKAQEEKRKKDEEERNRCKLDDYDVQDINRLVSSKTYDEAAAVIRSFNCVPVIYRASQSNRIESELVIDALKGRNLEEQLPKADLKNAIGLNVVRPKAPDFTITFREDPKKIADPDQLSLVPQPDGDWVLPAGSKNTSRVTMQVNERLTGRFVAGVTLQIFDGNTGTKLLETKTDENGEKTITLKTPKAGLINVNAIFDGPGAERMSAARDIAVKKLGDTVRTVCGRSLSLKDGAYRGSQAELDRCRNLEVVAANLGTGQGASQPRIPAIEQVPALTQDASQRLLAGSYNAVSITGTNTIVAAAPGVIATGGGNLIGQAGGNLRQETRAAAKMRRAGFFGAVGDFFNNVVTNVSRAFDQNLSNIRRVLRPSQAQAIAKTAAVLAQNDAAVPPQTNLSPKGVGVISVGGGNVISVGGGNVIAVGGGNLISDKGLGLVPPSSVIATGGGNLMPVNGGQVISTGGGN